RLVKWWRKTERDQNDPDFRFKSFAIELLWAYLADGGAALGDYPTALEDFFTFIVKAGLATRIAFTDHHSRTAPPSRCNERIEIFDPVNPKNNVTASYTIADRQRIEDAAHRALDALGEARYATTKADAVECWQDVLGPSFRG